MEWGLLDIMLMEALQDCLAPEPTSRFRGPCPQALFGCHGALRRLEHRMKILIWWGLSWMTRTFVTCVGTLTNPLVLWFEHWPTVTSTYWAIAWHDHPTPRKLTMWPLSKCLWGIFCQLTFLHCLDWGFTVPLIMMPPLTIHYLALGVSGTFKLL